MPEGAVVTAPVCGEIIMDTGDNVTHVLRLSPAGFLVLANASGFSHAILVEESQCVCLDAQAVDEILENMRLAGAQAAGPAVNPVPPFLVHALMQQYVLYRFDFILLSQLQGMMCELLEFCNSPVCHTLQCLMKVSHTEVNYSVHDPLWKKGWMKEDHDLLMTLRASRPPPPKD